MSFELDISKYTNDNMEEIIEYDLRKWYLDIETQVGGRYNKAINALTFYDSYDKEYTYSGISLLDPCVIPQGESLNKELWNDVLKPFTNDNQITGEVFHGLAKNINKVSDIEELDVAITE